MNMVKITVTNAFYSSVVEEFITRVDLSDLEEVEMAVEECCGQYLDMHHDIYSCALPDIDWDTFAEACEYIIEEVTE